MDSVEQGCSDVDADRLVERWSGWLDAASRATSCAWLEVYHRAAWTARVSMDRISSRPARSVGIEEGVAVRVWTAEGRGPRFAAVSGGGCASADQALALALSSSAEPGPARRKAAEVPGTRIDRDGDGSVPSFGELEAWLAVAGDRMATDARWVEVGTTAETWAASGRLLGSRRRTRGWARFETSDRSVTVAARDGRQLDADEPAAVLREEGRFLLGANALAVAPRPAADLVHALTRTLHLTRPPSGISTGPGWRVADDPTRPGALFGGAFDDEVHPNGRIELADGRSLLGTLGSAGTFRRPSYRDPPEALPAHLVASPPSLDLAPKTAVATSVVIHTLPSGVWVLDLEGNGPTDRFWVETDPADLVLRCMGGWGPVRGSHRGVETPGLVFDGLRVSR